MERQVADQKMHQLAIGLEMRKGKMFRVFPSGVKNGIMES
jgi:hypothetical protein